VRAIGINRGVHLKIDAMDRWHGLGDLVAPKDVWEEVVSLPGTIGLTIRGVRSDNYAGYIGIKFESSNIVEQAIFVERNDHYVLRRVATQPTSRLELFSQEHADTLDVAPSPDNLEVAVEILRNKWEESISEGNNTAAALWRFGGDHVE
jgi:hypothetical protein